MFRSIVRATAALALVAGTAQAQFTQDAGFRLRNTSGSAAQEELYYGFSNDLGSQPRLAVNGTFALNQPNAFSLDWDATARRLEFVYRGFSGPSRSYVLTYDVGATPSFNAIRFILRGSEASRTSLSGIALASSSAEFSLGDLVANDGAVSRIFEGVSAAESFRVTGDLTFAGAGVNGEGQRFEVGVGTVVPEPSTYALMATGLIGLAGMARRRRRA